MTSEIILHINRQGRVLSYRVEGVQSEGHEPIWPQYTQVVTDALINDLQQHASIVLRSVSRTGLGAELKDLGLLLYDNLVPEGIRLILREHCGPLYLWTEVSSIPWEILHDGDQYWGAKYPMGRRIIASVPLRFPIRRKAAKNFSILVVAANPNGDLIWVDEEAESIVSSLDEDAEICVLSGSRATPIEVIRELRKGTHTIIHYCGHAISDTVTGEGSLLLAENSTLPSSTIRANLKGNPVVFLNACQSARGCPETELSGLWTGLTASLADGFLVGGASGVIGTLADVGDWEGREFAKEFYKNILSGLGIGGAIRSTRLQFLNHSPDNPIWSAFVLFGSPSGGIWQSCNATPTVPAPFQEREEGEGELPSQPLGVTRWERQEQERAWQEVVSMVKPAVLHVETDRGAGTGFLISDGSYALTCHHVVKNAKTVMVRFIDGRQVEAGVFGFDKTLDLALLKLIQTPVLSCMRFASTEKIQEGQTVLAIGHPMGFAFTVSRGIVSSRCRVLGDVTYVQTDAALNPGNSGGPIICETGEVIGVASFIVGMGVQGIGFGVATPHIRGFLAKYRIPIGSKPS